MEIAGRIARRIGRKHRRTTERGENLIAKVVYTGEGLRESVKLRPIGSRGRLSPHEHPQRAFSARFPIK